ncbi:MAG: hypothetical protein GX838_06675 [Clostridiaceae bacterium]|nr:hypothetical protein [Clostridiaceae bacterium]
MGPQAVIEKLQALRDHALQREADVYIQWSAEDSHMVRYANSAVSLNSHEAITRLQVAALGDHKQTSTRVTVDSQDLEAMKTAIDKAIDMLPFAAPMSYQPTLPHIKGSSVSQDSYDPEIEQMTSDEIIEFVNRAVEGLETGDILLSGNFSAGASEVATISTATPDVVYWRASDIGITLVLASEKRKWEINAEQFVYRKKDLDAKALHDRLRWLSDLYNTQAEVRVPEGPCKVVLGPAALAEYLRYMGYIGYRGGTKKRGHSMFKEADVGQQVFSPDFTLTEDPSLKETFAMPVDFYGRRREKRDLIDQGRLTGVLWDRQSADEFGQEPTGHDTNNDSIVVRGGQMDIQSIQEFAKLPREEDILYVPFLHYMNIVNPSEGQLTAISRFGALLLKKDGSIELPYNVRFTEKLRELLGDKLQWMSRHNTPYGSSTHYYGRDPYALLVPALTCFDGVNVEISNESFG